ncbi:glycosyl hydrolase 53 family protein [Olivibacter sp. SDN3]|uniref:glycosyl hydrolase n=1 Tax=Olivibacter sp. SDN3 TaxID=2764720 RepID=UPI001650ED60|nr:glycosyl hydrolase [Olivibacter sp. SDN3]QNL52047.1 glycosyl hydrolase 53 family protein [Olivibacter sp. SDN3]
MNRIIIFLSCLWITTAFKNAQAQQFAWGINGHPFTQEAYKKSTWEDQIAFIKDLNLSHYRFDVILTQDGLVHNHQLFSGFLEKLKAKGIVAMPVLSPRTKKMVGDSSTVYQTYFSQGEAFAKKYGRFFDVIEVGNEWDVLLMKKNASVDGTKPQHYDLDEAKKRMWLLSGFIDGFKSVKKIKVSLSLTWTHWYYLELLEQYNIDYDIIGYHWYSNMGDILNARKPYGNILSKVEEKFGKEIWITEFNTHLGARKSSLERQQTYVETTIQRLIKQGIVKGIFIYELFDQPALAKRYPSEVNFGLIYKEDSSYRKRPVYYAYQSLINSSGK